MIIDWKIGLSLSIPALIAVAGWFFAHWLTSKRDRLSKRRELRLKGLEKAYLKVAGTAHRELTPEMKRDFEDFVSEIQLYGTPNQIKLMSELVEAFVRRDKIISFDAILEDLRDSLRSELNMERISGHVWWYRFQMPKPPEEKKPNQPTEPTAFGRGSS